MRFIVQCPRCKSHMQYKTETIPKDKMKRCVYCNNNFCVYRNVNNNQIVKRIDFINKLFKN